MIPSVRNLARALAVVVTACTLSGCTVKANLPGDDRKPPPPPPVKQTEARPQTPSEKLASEGDAAFAKRSDPVELARAIERWRESVAVQDSFDVRVKLARAEHFVAESAPPGEPGRAQRLEAFQRGLEQARAALRLRKVEEGANCAEKAKREDVPALYWLAENLQGLARELGLSESGEQRKLALCLAERAAELDPEYFHGGPTRLLGALLSQEPALAGGDLARSRKMFDKSLLAGPSYLQTRVDLASTWAVKKQEKAAFLEALNAVLVAPVDVVPDIEPENRLARERARKLLERERELF